MKFGKGFGVSLYKNYHADRHLAEALISAVRGAFWSLSGLYLFQIVSFVYTHYEVITQDEVVLCCYCAGVGIFASRWERRVEEGVVSIYNVHDLMEIGTNFILIQK